MHLSVIVSVWYSVVYSNWLGKTKVVVDHRSTGVTFNAEVHENDSICFGLVRFGLV